MPALSAYQIKELIYKELPLLLKKDEELKKYVLLLIEKTAAPKKRTEDRFEQLLSEIHALRDEGNRKWAEWEKKWEENQKRWELNTAELKLLHRKYDQGMGAIGSRWGFHTESTFRNAITGILSEITTYKVEHFEEKDFTGEVFGYPENIEIDLIISNGQTFIAEIKSSVSDADVRDFIKKAKWWEKQKKIKSNGLIIISPMIHPKAKSVIEHFDIRCFSYTDEVQLP
ncbi:MAG: DUF3782 domain-containing protein [Bacteroidia bacterium]|nr:DUF3782 domain-containing protein [Bacteroidia bacterium]